MVRYLLATLVIVLLGYGAVEAYPILAGPSLTLTAPAPFVTATSGLITVTGRAYRAVALTLDGAPVLPDQDGSFSSSLALPSGGSILTLTATDRFGRTITRTREVYVP